MITPAKIREAEQISQIVYAEAESWPGFLDHFDKIRTEMEFMPQEFTLLEQARRELFIAYAIARLGVRP